MICKKTTYLKIIQTGVFLSSLFWHSNTIAQTYFSVREDYLRSKSSVDPVSEEYRNTYPDTTVNKVAFYSVRNFGGNTGLPSAPYLFQRKSQEPGFIFYRPFFNSDRIHVSDVRYYRTTGPFAELTGIAGTGKLQMFRLLFSHTPAEKMNITLRLNQYTSGGFYKRQQSRITNLYLSSNFEGSRHRAGYYFYVLHNGVYASENGGIRDTFLNSKTALQTKSLLAVRLSAANRNNRQTRVEFQPYLRLQREKDTLRNTDHLLSLQFSFEDQSFRYQDRGIATDGFYNNRYRDSLYTMDSAHVRQFRNGISYLLKDRKKGRGLELGYRNEVSQVWQISDDLIINNIVKGMGYLHPRLKDSLQRLSLQGTAWSVFNGYNAGDLAWQGVADWQINVKKGTALSLAGGFENRRPDQQFLKWQSNHFQWQEAFAQQQKTELELAFQFRGFFGLKVLQQNIHHLLYFNEQALPQQLQGTARNTALSLSLAKVIFRHLGLFAEHRFQYSSAASALRFPGQVTTARIFYAGNLSKNKLQLNIGAQVQLYQGFLPYAYMPATQVFYLQSAVRTSTFPYVDVYLSGRIRPVSFFVKAENLLANILAYDYFLQPGYFQPNAAIRLGISWMFFD